MLTMISLLFSVVPSEIVHVDFKYLDTFNEIWFELWLNVNKVILTLWSLTKITVFKMSKCYAVTKVLQSYLEWNQKITRDNENKTLTMKCRNKS